MESLPTEVLVSIFGYLGVSDILSCIKVSDHLQYCVTDTFDYNKMPPAVDI